MVIKQIAYLNTLTWISVLLIAKSSAQIPINGFCKYERISADEGFNKIITLNYNGDSYTDLLLLNTTQKSAVTYNGSFNYKFIKARINKTPGEISSVLPAGRKSGKNNYIFASRKSRTIGQCEISSSGRIRILNQKKLDYYPVNLNNADIEKDSIDEVLVSGSSFKGLFVFKFSGRQIIENAINNKNLYSHSIFTDLDNDEYSDIAAFDLITNKLEFFYNNTQGFFRKTREYLFTENISTLQAYDMNLDSYNDLIIGGKKSIQIMFGDNVSSYDDGINILTEFAPDKIVTADFNRDGYNDIAYLNKESGLVNVIFAKNHKEFYPEVNYLNKNKIEDLVPFYSRFIYGLLAYGSDGNFYLIDRLKVIEDNTKISLGYSPCSISYFDAGKNKIIDFCYFDKEKNKLNLIVRNNAGIPVKYYSLRISEKFDKVITDEKLEQQKTFYCFSKNKRFVEIISVDFNNEMIVRDKIYTPGEIADIKIQPQEENRAKIYVTFIKEGSLGFAIYEYKNFRYIETVSKGIANNVINAHLALEDTVSIFFWEKTKSSYSFNKTILNRELKPEKFITKFSMPLGKTKFITILGDIYNKEKEQAASFIYSDDKRIAVLTTDNESKVINFKRRLLDFNIQSEADLYFGESRFNGLNRIFTYNTGSNYLERLEIFSKDKTLLTTKLIECQNLDSYFIKNLNFRNYHLVYIDKKENCITIKELK